jgi:ribosomal protein L24
MLKIGDIVRVIAGIIFVGKEGKVVSFEGGYIQVLIFGSILYYDFLPQELERVK